MHFWDGGKWSSDSLIPSISTNYDDLEDKTKSAYKISPGEFIETYGIVHIEPGQFEVYTDLGKRAGNKGTNRELKLLYGLLQGKSRMVHNLLLVKRRTIGSITINRSRCNQDNHLSRSARIIPRTITQTPQP